ncbi:hypothetical protein HMPREF3038_00190 [Akkermansia sp. KLE1797]|nr:hypothetical protein HMPREF3038_00190 [Akkermansia sp. KLE1797]
MGRLLRRGRKNADWGVRGKWAKWTEWTLWTEWTKRRKTLPAH